MRKQITGFIAGAITTALIGSLGLSALAATGRMTINVDPVNIQVNGQTFKPTDAKGTEVPVFAYQGTTYAPLRALAEAYGLEVGYDSAANMATVGTSAPVDSGITYRLPDNLDSYDEFKALWRLHQHEGSAAYSALMISEVENSVESKERFKKLWNGASKEQRNSLMRQYLDDTREEYPDCEYIGFIFDGGSLGGVGIPDTGFVDVRDVG